MKKIGIILIIFTILVLNLNPQTKTDSTTDINKEISNLKSELVSMKKDIEDIKQKTDWFSFKVDGQVRITYGVNVWARENGFDVNSPITHGFDFDNKIRFQMILGNKIIATSSESGDLGTEVSIALKIKSLGVAYIKPEGSYYLIKGKDDQGNDVDIYMPKSESGSTNVVFGNFQLILDEAKVKNILGTGLFINYQDVMQVDQYYGPTGIADILSLNYSYFDNGYVIDWKTYKKNRDATDRNRFYSLYYSFDPEFYEPVDQVAEAMKLWSNNMLYKNPQRDAYNQKYDQRPHGISAGYSKGLTEGFEMNLEVGAASKDAFDPKYYEDNFIDYGFFAKFEPRFHNDRFEFQPKLSASFAFQTETKKDYPTQWSTFAGGLSLPLTMKFPSLGKDDHLRLELDYNINVHIVNSYFANLISFLAEGSFFNGKFTFSLPVIYSFKNTGERGGFQRIGNGDVKYIDQLYDDHVLNTGLILGFDSKNLFGDLFELIFKNTFYYTLMIPMDGRFYSPKSSYPVKHYPGPEQYLFEIFRNDFVFNKFLPEKLGVYYEFGIGYLNNAKLIGNSVAVKYQYDRANDAWIDTDKHHIMEWPVWCQAAVVSVKTGIYVNIMKNLSVGFDAESPKLSLNTVGQKSKKSPYNIDPNSVNPIGNQQSYGVYKLWTEIKF